VRVDGKVGVGKGSALGTFRNELNVEDLPRIPSLARVGEDLLDAVEPCRNSGAPGIAKAVEDRARALCEGDGNEDWDPWGNRPTLSTEGERSAVTGGDSGGRTPEELTDVRETAGF
jgi:hypothetical protein